MKLSDLDRANKIRSRFKHLQSLWNGHFDERHYINAKLPEQIFTHVLSQRSLDAAIAVLREEAEQEIAALKEEAAQIGLNLDD